MKIKDMFKLGKAQVDIVSEKTKKAAHDIGEIDITKEDVSKTGKSLGRKIAKTAAVSTAFTVSVGAAATVFTPGLLPAMVGILGAGATYKLLNKKKKNDG